MVFGLRGGRVWGFFGLLVVFLTAKTPSIVFVKRHVGVGLPSFAYLSHCLLTDLAVSLCKLTIPSTTVFSAVK